jgi:drug/metabolite transporter (DMT)-like permease
MTALQVTFLTVYAFAMALGQGLFKSAASRLAAGAHQTFTDHFVRFFKLLFDPLFVLAIVLYMAISVFWVWILSFTPLSRAYPFGALAFVFTIGIGALYFRETVTHTHLIGLACIVLGIVVIACD